MRRLSIAGLFVAAMLALPTGPARSVSGLSITMPMASPAGELATGPRANGTAVLPDGRVVTPVGRTIEVELLPLNTVLSHDGKRLYVSSEGGDGAPGGDEDVYNRFISVVDTATMKVTRVQDDALQFGLGETPDGRTLYVSEGETGKVGVFSVAGGGLARAGEVALDPEDFPHGLAVAPDGKHTYVVGFRGNSLSVIDTATNTRVGRVAAGQYPYTVAVSPDGKRAYVSNWGLFNQKADEVLSNVDVATVPPATLGGYNTDESSSVWFYDLSDPANPTVQHKVKIGKLLDGYAVVSGSLPSSMAVSPDGSTLAVTASNNDLVVLLDAATGAVRRTIDLHVFTDGPTGAQPNALTWSPDGKVLYVAEGGRNTVALVDPVSGAVAGRIPTGWYPSAVTVTPDGGRLFVASAKGLGAGPNGVEFSAGDKFGNRASYIGNLLNGTLQEIPLGAACSDLSRLSLAADKANGFVAAAVGDASVVPARYGDKPSSKIGHVVFILKENRTYDQIFGDLAGTERDERLGFYTGQVTPNHHALAQQFGHGQNFYDVGQDSFDGHFIIDSGHENEFDQKIHPTVWNANKLGPEGLYVSAPENLPEGGYLWNNLYRHGVDFKIYGEATYLLGLGPTELVPPSQFDPSQPRQFLPAAFALQDNYSLTYPSQITPSRPDGEFTDEDRADDFLRDLQVMETTGRMPKFLFLWLTDDHTHGASPGEFTAETLIARNDHAMARMIEGLSKSRFWNDMAIMATEDDPQDGQDHVDAHRTIQLVVSPYGKRGYASTVHHSNMSALKTINLLLGVPPTSIQEASATSLADYFAPTAQVDPRFTAVPMQVTPETNPTAAQASNAQLKEAALLQRTTPSGLDEGGSALQEILRLRHEGAVAAGNPNVPVLGNEVEHHLAQGAPEAVTLGPDPGGSAAAVCVAAVATAQAPGRLAGTGGTARVGFALALVALAVLLRRRPAPTALP
jgi:YVTN family beta-propeller protein